MLNYGYTGILISTGGIFMDTASKAEAVRLPYLDYLRVMAAAAVIMIHVSAQNWDNVPVMS